MVLPETSNLPETTPAAGSKSSAGCRPSSKEEKRSRLGLLRLPHEDRFNFLVSESAGKLNISARVAKLADARDLKSRVPKGTYRFNSGPGHQASLRRLKDFTVVLVFPNCPIGRVTSERFGCYSGPFCSRVNP